MLVAIFIAYQPVWHGEFIWDDDAHISKNPCIIGPIGIKGIWTTASAMYYPLVLTSFWVQHALWGLNPIPYHVVNIAIHAGCALLLWRILMLLKIRGAWLGAALWALHPVQVESVAWITELKNTQSCLFYLLSILFFLKWRQAGASLKDGHLWPKYAVSLLCAVAAILSKSSTVMLPLALGLCWWWIDGQWRWRNVTKLIPFVCVSLTAAVWTIWEQMVHSRAAGGEWALTFPERVIIAGRDVWFYLGKLFWPHPLIFIYPRWQIDPSRPLAYLPMLAAMAGFLLLWWKRNGQLRPVFFAAAYFVVSLFPVLGFFNVYFFRYSFVGDHFQYLADIGPLCLAGAAIVKGCNLLIKQSLPLRASVSAVLLILLFVLTRKEASIYFNRESLWRDTVRKNPTSWIALDNVGSILLEKGQVNDALQLLQKALQENPNNAVTYTNLGYAFLVLGRLNDSFQHLERALELDPNDAAAHSNMANTLLQLGRTGDAFLHLREALNLNPSDSEFQKNMAWFLATAPESGLRNGLEAVKLAASADKLTDGRDAVVKTTLAAAYAEAGRYDEAIETAESALQLANQSGNSALAEGIRAHIASYRSGQPVRDIR